MSSTVHVAFDLGAESGRAMVGHFRGERLELDEVRRFPTRSVRLPDGLYWDALGLLGELTSALDQAQRNPAAEDHPAVAHADSALVRATEALTHVLLSEEPIQALKRAKAAIADARRGVEAAQAAMVRAGH